MSVVCTIEARMGSSRLPGKVMKSLAGKPMLEHIVERSLRAKRIDNIIIATTDGIDNKPITELAHSLNVKVFLGSESDVLGRVANAVRSVNASVVVALTGDNPFVDPCLIDDMVSYFYANDFDYLTNTHMMHSNNWDAVRTFPIGVSVQIIKASVLLEMDREVTEIKLREHSTLSIYDRNDSRYKLGAFEAKDKYLTWKHPELRMTVDTLEDFILAEKIYDYYYENNSTFSTVEAIAILLKNREWNNLSTI